MMTFVTWNSNLVHLLQGLCTSYPCIIEFSFFWVFAGNKPTTSRLTVLYRLRFMHRIWFFVFLSFCRKRTNNVEIDGFYLHVLYYVYVLHMHISYTCVHLVSEGGDIRISSRLYIYLFIHIYTYIYNYIYIYIYIRRFLHGYTCLDIICIHSIFQK